jgi:uncharacterized protein (UPF0335 family)
MIPPPPTHWPGLEGNSMACREKLKVLAENHAELAQTMQDTFDDAILMGVEESAMRAILTEMIAGLESPKRASR